jgi:cytoskeletal protein CcmA (bactofilin family)
MKDNEAEPEGCAFFGNGVAFKGSISVPQKLVIHGTVQGDIESRELFVGPTGVIKGNVRVDEADVQGKIFENIEARTYLRLGKTGQIEGKAVYGEIEIEKGGVLSGEIFSIDSTANSQTTTVQLNKAADRAVDDTQTTSELANKLNRTMRGWASYFNIGTVAKAYRAIDSYTAMRFRRSLYIKPVDMPQLVPPAKSETICGSIANGADAGSQLEELTKTETKTETQEETLMLDDTVRS